MYLSVHPKNPQGRHIAKAAEVLRNGGIIIYPTDTVYGIGCSIFDSAAIERIYRLKRQEKSKTFSFICSDLSHIAEYAKVSNTAYRLMKQCVPGPFTFILPAARLKQLPKSLISKRKTVGIRVPDNHICQMLVKELGHPVLNASVPDAGGEIIADPENIYAAFENRVDLMLGGEHSVLEFSTILDLTEDRPVVVREGAGDVRGFLAMDQTEG
jgi:tRNA threonylcarbamoyl adenosine modification protein (Sua5/YciO/YrdC/YwlC family)